MQATKRKKTELAVPDENTLTYDADQARVTIRFLQSKISKKQGDFVVGNLSVLLVNFIFFAVKMLNVNLFCAMVLAESA